MNTSMDDIYMDNAIIYYVYQLQYIISIKYQYILENNISKCFQHL